MLCDQSITLTKARLSNIKEPFRNAVEIFTSVSKRSFPQNTLKIKVCIWWFVGLVLSHVMGRDLKEHSVSIASHVQVNLRVHKGTLLMSRATTRNFGT